jgi:hypothetical protein
MGLLAGLCILSGTGCQTSTGFEDNEAAGVVTRLRSHQLAVKGEGTRQPRSVLPPAGGRRVERVEGGLTVSLEKPSRGDSRRLARVVLPEVAQRPFQVKDIASGLTMDVALEGALPAKAEVVDGYVVYPNAHPEGADVVHRFTPEGTEDYLSFDRAPSVPEVRYGLSLGAGVAGLRLVDDTLELLDGSGAPRLRMAPPYLVGADGRVTQAHVSVEGCAVDTRASAPWERPVTAPGSRRCRVRVGWTAGAVRYPAVLDPVWSTTGSLATARRRLTTTVLPDGRVLAVGGSGSMSGLVSSAELYDPTTGTWATTGALALGREFHTATLLGSGKVLVAAGQAGDPLYARTETAELYDPSTGTWSSAGSLNTARQYHRSILLDDGRVLALGGEGPSWATLASAELYDPATDTWTLTGSLSAPRSYHGAVRLSDGKVLAIGGGDYTTAFTSELYDPATGTWTLSGSTATDWSNPLTALLADGRVLVAGGYTPTAEVYDPATGTWSPTGFPALNRYAATATLLPDGRVLVAGGMSQTSGSQEVAVSELYDPATGVWSLGASLQGWRSMHATSLLQDGRVLVVGGMGSTDYVDLSSAEVLLLDVDDVTAPTATLTSPAEGASVEGEVLLTASASDDYSVARVEFYAGDTLIGTDGSAPFSVSWYTPWNVANGPYVLTARAYDASGNLGTSAPVSILVNNDVTPPTVTVTSPAADSTLQGLISLSADALDDSGVNRVEFWDGGTLLGIDYEAPYSLSWNTTGVSNGGHTLTAKAYDAAGNEGTSAQVQVTVGNAPPPGPATYDTTLGAPRCGATGASCDSGTLLNGRAGLGPEANAPNTVDTCSDATWGSYHFDESLDRLKVSTLDGTNLAAGKTVRIEATVWAYSSYSADYLDLYFAPEANAPSWTLLGTMSPTGSGSRVLSREFTLPSSASARAVVRGVFRYGGSAGTCPGGSYTDVDDLVFSAR